RSKNLNHSPTRKPTNAKGTINQNIPGRNDVDIRDLVASQAHDGTFTIIFGNLLNRQIEILVSRSDNLAFVSLFFSFGGNHICSPLSKARRMRFAKYKSRNWRFLPHLILFFPPPPAVRT